MLVIALGLVPHAPGLGSGLDTVAHFAQFAILTIWFGGIFASSRHGVIAVLLILLGTAIEVSQAANIYRQFDIVDIAANISGVLFGLLLLRFVLRDWCLRVESILLQAS